MQEFYSTSELANLAKQVRKEKTQKEIATLLGVSKQAISKAENPEVGKNINSLRIRIIETLSQRNIDGPYWRVKKE